MYVENPNYSLSSYFSGTIRVKNQYHAFLNLPSYKFLHCFSSSIDQITSFLLKNAINTIYHPTDVLINAKHQNPALQNAQFEAFEDADRISYRDLTSLDIKTLRPLIKHKKSIFFPEYVTSTPSTQKLDGLHIVSTGNLQTGNSDNGDELFSFVNKVVSRGIYFHIYPFWGWAQRSKTDFLDHHSRYRDLSKQYPNLIIHSVVNPDQLIHEISKYHFGIMIIPEFELKYCSIESYYTLNWLSKVTSSRITDYMEAGLITITNWSTKKDLCYRIPNRYSQCLNYRDVIDADDPVTFLYQTINTHKKSELNGYSISKNIKRLITFYNS